MDALDEVGSREGKQVVVALQFLFVSFEQVSTKILLHQLVPLNHGSHRTIQNDNSFFQCFCFGCQFLNLFVSWHKALYGSLSSCQ